jgi:drug/metabolite transporter (DMT)-like permease
VTALVGALPQEPVGPRRWAAVCVGFVGALIVVRPGQAHFDWHALLIVGSTLCSALLPALFATLRPDRAPDASATMATIVGTVAASPFLPFDWVTPTGGWHWTLFVGMGVMAGVGHYFLTIAYSQAPAAVVAPFNYVQLVGAALLGYLVFGDIPDAWSWVGAGVIVASGLYIGHRERIRHRLRQSANKN